MQKRVLSVSWCWMQGQRQKVLAISLTCVLVDCVSFGCLHMLLSRSLWCISSLSWSQSWKRKRSSIANRLVSYEEKCFLWVFRPTWSRRLRFLSLETGNCSQGTFLLTFLQIYGIWVSLSKSTDLSGYEVLEKGECMTLSDRVYQTEKDGMLIKRTRKDTRKAYL